jgi:hypothetical protein
MPAKHTSERQSDLKQNTLSPYQVTDRLLSRRLKFLIFPKRATGLSRVPQMSLPNRNSRYGMRFAPVRE